MSRKKPPVVRSAYTLEVPETPFSDALDLQSYFLDFVEVGTKYLDSDGSAHSRVVSMSTLALIGMVQAFTTPGICMALSRPSGP